MAEITVKTPPSITRDTIARVFKDHEMQVAFESLLSDVSTTLPQASNETGDQITSLQDDVSDVQDQVGDLSTMLAAAAATIADQQAQINSLSADSSGLISQLSSIREQVATMARAIKDIEQAPL